MNTIGGGLLPDEEALARVFAERYSRLFAQGKQLLDLGFSFPPSATCRKDELQFIHAVLGLYTKAVKTFRAVHLLCARGLSDDAMALSRTLLEIMTSIYRLAEGDRRENAKTFWEYMALKQDELYGLFDIEPGPGSDDEGRGNELREVVDEIKSRMTPDQIKDWLGRSWHRRGAIKLSEEIGLPSVKIPYKFASGAIHGSDVIQHLEVGDDLTVTLKAFPSDAWTKKVLFTANLTFLLILRKVNDFCQLGLEQRIISASDELEAYAKEFGKEVR